MRKCPFHRICPLFLLPQYEHPPSLWSAQQQMTRTTKHGTTDSRNHPSRPPHPHSLAHGKLAKTHDNPYCCTKKANEKLACSQFKSYICSRKRKDMRTRHDYITLLRQYAKAKAEVYGIMKIGIFGSVARNEQTEDSDVDICVEISKPDLFTMVHIKDELQELFERPVDIVRLRSNMNPILFQQIQRDGIYV